MCLSYKISYGQTLQTLITYKEGRKQEKIKFVDIIQKIKITSYRGLAGVNNLTYNFILFFSF